MLASAQEQAAKVVTALGGHGLFGVEFFIAGDQAIFSELSPRPHDTGMVTLIGQSPNEFELHLRAILGLPIPAIDLAGAVGSAVILADRESDDFRFRGVGDASPSASPRRRSTSASSPSRRPSRTAAWASRLAQGETVDATPSRVAKRAASQVRNPLSCINMHELAYALR